jgi:hypothetical protein
MGKRDETILGHAADEEGGEIWQMELANVLQTGEEVLQCQTIQFLTHVSVGQATVKVTTIELNM